MYHGRKFEDKDSPGGREVMHSKQSKKYSFTAKTTHTSPYSLEYIHDKSIIGLNPKLAPSRKGLGARKASALRLADQCQKRLDNRDMSWLKE